MSSRWARELNALEIESRTWLDIQNRLKDLKEPTLSAPPNLEQFRENFQSNEGVQQPFLSGIYTHWRGVLMQAFRNRLLKDVSSLLGLTSQPPKDIWLIMISYLDLLVDIHIQCPSSNINCYRLCIREFRHPSSLKLLNDKKEGQAVDSFECFSCRRVAHVGFAPFAECKHQCTTLVASPFDPHICDPSSTHDFNNNCHQICALCTATLLSSTSSDPVADQI